MPWLHEMIFLLFSAAEMMLDSLTKAFIVDTLQRQRYGVSAVHTSDVTRRNVQLNGSFPHGAKLAYTSEAMSAEYVKTSQDTNWLGLLTSNEPSSESEVSSDLSTATSFRDGLSGSVSDRNSTRDSWWSDSVTSKFSMNISSTEDSLSLETKQNDSMGLENRTATYLMVNQVCLYLPWVLLGIFVGSWSDRHGRKPLMVLPCAAHVLSVLIYQLTSYVPGRLMAVVVGGALIRGACGKQAMFMVATNCLLSDRLPSHRRPTRFAVLLGFRYIGAFLGNLLGGFLLDVIGVKYTMLTSAGMHALCMITVVVAVKETVRQTPSISQRKNDRRDAERNTEIWPRGVFSRWLEKLKNRSHRYRGFSGDEERIPILSKKDTGGRTGRDIYTRNMDNGGTKIPESDVSAMTESIANIDPGYPEATLGTYPKRAETIRPVHPAKFKNITDAAHGDTEVTSEQDVVPSRSNERITDHTPMTREGDSERVLSSTGLDAAPELTATDRKRNLLMCSVTLVVAFVTQSVWNSHREVIILSVSAPPLRWAVSTYGYLYAAYYGAGGLGLIALTPLISTFSPPDVDRDFVTLVFALLNGIVSTLWIGFAVTWNSKWQVYAAFALAALSLLSNSSLRSMLSGSVRADQQGTAMAVMSVQENLSKVIGPVFHTFVLVLSLPAYPALVYYVMSGETWSMLVVAIVMQLCLRRKTTG